MGRRRRVFSNKKELFEMKATLAVVLVFLFVVIVLANHNPSKRHEKLSKHHRHLDKHVHHRSHEHHHDKKHAGHKERHGKHVDDLKASGRIQLRSDDTTTLEGNDNDDNSGSSPDTLDTTTQDCDSDGANAGLNFESNTGSDTGSDPDSDSGSDSESNSKSGGQNIFSQIPATITGIIFGGLGGAVECEQKLLSNIIKVIVNNVVGNPLRDREITLTINGNVVYTVTLTASSGCFHFFLNLPLPSIGTFVSGIGCALEVATNIAKTIFINFEEGPQIPREIALTINGDTVFDFKLRLSGPCARNRVKIPASTFDNILNRHGLKGAGAGNV